VALAREVDARELLVEADADVRIRLVVAQADVEARAVALDELLLRQQRLGLGLGDEEVDRRDLGTQVAESRHLLLREVRRHTLADRARLADVDHPSARVAEDVHARLIGQLAALFLERVCGLRHLRKG
jgi:hypothetical protein